MNILKTMRTVAAASTLGSVFWAAGSDHCKAELRETLSLENRKPTSQEFQILTSNSPGFYLSLISIPAYAGILLVDERRKNKTNPVIDYQI